MNARFYRLKVSFGLPTSGGQSDALFTNSNSFLSQGDDIFTVSYYFAGYDKEDRYAREKKRFSGKTHLTWDKMFYQISPQLIDEASENQIRELFKNLILENDKSFIVSVLNENGLKLSGVSLVETDYQTMKIQLKALGLMNKSVRKRSLTDNESYWTLTPYGDTVMTRLRAIKKAE